MHRQSGFSMLTLLLLAATLAAALVFVVVGGGPNVQGQLNAQKAAQLVAQAQLVVHRITKCATDYPAGDNGTTYHKPYPKDGNTGVPVALAVTALVCPGNNQNLWSGVDGTYPPAPIADFGAWTYTNANPAVITITTTKLETNGVAITQAVSKMGSTVASATTGSVAGDTLTVKVIE
jgi:type II secretory pathway pseudopilin PulG